MDRKIGEYIGKAHGSLVVCIGGIHGNETAGIEALKKVLKMLEREPERNPEFVFKGKFLAIHGNLEAIKSKKRFIEKDLNRNFNKQRLDNLSTSEVHEDKEAQEIIALVRHEILAYRAEKLLLIDLHTTSSPGGIFTIIPEDDRSLDIARSMHAPIIRGMTKGVQGTTMHYFNSVNMGLPTKSITFESGQHKDPNAIIIAVAAVIAALRSLGSVMPHDVESIHDEILKNYSLNLPSLTKLIMKHSIHAGDGFEMLPGYLNFQAVKKGEVVAKDKDGNIAVPEDGLLLMPLYQKQGEDGFFLIKRIEQYEFH